ncbi:MAG: Asp-tRNA(Asn)/Glu-tRNA(Gln) amidotransferase subunit GatC [Planctomycetes bacterium]|nr:Asp-tRNA(Asn)/Glu-tRNA(Gln) amidotransferase subunit GatC [Planctomycetota bacterium]
MRFPREQIDYVAHLARLALSDAEREQFGAQLASILAYVEKLNELDTTDVPPTVQAMGLRNVFREDAEQPSADRVAMLANAPAQACGCYLVPKILG